MSTWTGSPGLPAFTVAGLPDAAVQEPRERVRAAIRNSGCEFPLQRITVNLAPADLRKEGPAYDLPMVVSPKQRDRDTTAMSKHDADRASATWATEGQELPSFRGRVMNTHAESFRRCGAYCASSLRPPVGAMVAARQAASVG